MADFKERLEELVEDFNYMREDLGNSIEDIENRMDDVYELIYELEEKEDAEEEAPELPIDITEEQAGIMELEDEADDCDELEEDHPGYLFEIDDVENAPVPMVV